jgi:hypothetical protein
MPRRMISATDDDPPDHPGMLMRDTAFGMPLASAPPSFYDWKSRGAENDAKTNQADPH